MLAIGLVFNSLFRVSERLQLALGFSANIVIYLRTRFKVKNLISWMAHGRSLDDHPAPVKLLTSEEIDGLSTTFPKTQKPLLIVEFSAKQKASLC